MKKTRSTYTALIAILLTPAAANAAPIEIEATPVNENAWSGFSMIFDYDESGAVFPNNFISFSGVTFFFSPDNPVYFDGFDPTFMTPITLFQDGTALPSGEYFWFTGPEPYNALNGNTSDWRYRWSEVTVPEPGTLALLGIGLAALGLSRRRGQI